MEWSEDSGMGEEETWKVYHNPLYSGPSDLTFAANAEMADLIKTLSEERARREAAERANEELLGQEAEVARMRREVDEEKKMMRVAEVFREGKHNGLVSPEPQNPHIRRGIRGSVEFQRALKAMCSLNKTLAAQNKIDSQKAHLKILFKQRIPLRSNHTYFTT